MIEYAKLTDTPSFIYKYRERENKTYKFSDTLIKRYHEFHNEIIQRYTLSKEDFNKRVECLNTKKCFCGSDLMYIKFADFWGCKNFRDNTVRHVTFTGLNPVVYPIGGIINVNWITDIIKDCGLKGVLFAKDVYEFFIQNGLEDLRLKYGHNSTESKIMGLVKANNRSKVQESEANEYLKSIYPKVVYQQCITYKLHGKKESFCIPDFIVSNRDNVKIIDAKLDYGNDDKMDLYVSLVKFIMDINKDKRLISGAHIFYHEAESVQYFNSRHEIIMIPCKA